MRKRAKYSARLLCGTAMAVVTMASAPAMAREAGQPINIEPQPLASALREFASQSQQAILVSPALADNKSTQGVRDTTNPEIALAALLEGTGLTWRRSGEALLIVQGGSADPQSGSAAGDGADGTVDTLIVTAQKREEDIQDVPIAISAFSQEDLETRQVAGGPDLITQIPNFSFTKTNFTSYSIQIRGIGTQAISATTDPAVAVAFNNTPFIRNRFFEQEFYDLERLEVLRGPQGTLYGRNATAGVVNLISAKPKFIHEAKASVDIGNYRSRRIEGMINIPLVEDAVALRIAGAWTKREGYATNQMTGAQIDGRDLWSVRTSLRFEPTDWISANFIYEHFQEDDDRLRSGKQLCKKDPAPTDVGGITLSIFNPGGAFGQQTYYSQGCLPVSLYSPEAFQTPNGYSLPYYGPTQNLGNPVFPALDPYLSSSQSRDLRVIESSVEPDYRANTNIAELQVAVDIGDFLTLNSETSYGTDELFSLQDFNRFTTVPHAFNTAGGVSGPKPGLLDADGVFCDPQLGCSDRLLLVDLSTSDSSQFSQEFRLASDFDGPFNFSLGANFLRHDAMDKYYVFINSLSMFVANSGPVDVTGPYVPGVSDNSSCLAGTAGTGSFNGPGGVGDTAPLADPNVVYSLLGCKYLDPNPIGALNDQGRNYFLSKNPYRLISYAAFGEIYYNVTDTLKITGGLRWTVDKKQAPQIPSWLLQVATAGPYPVTQIVEQEWKEPTGRLTVDWHPDLGFTEDTLLYASYAHGYKAGGANPPPPVLVSYTSVTPQEILPDTFGPEFVDAFEVGAKNTLFGGALTLNLTSFYYDYTGYQTSEIRNRSAVNSNYDTEVWGIELEADWRITDALRLGFKGGYNGTRIADGQEAVDLMDRTAGHVGPDGEPDWYVVRPFPSIPSNCILPLYVLTAGGVLGYNPASGDQGGGWCTAAYYSGLDPVTQLPYVANPTVRASGAGTEPLPANYDDYVGFDPSTAPNNGRGFAKQLGGNELPNAPRYTATVTVDYTMPLPNDWLVNFHGDYHYQSESWGRVFNSDPYDRIEGFSTVNLSAIFINEDAGWKVMTYIKNAFDETAITGTFLNSDDTGLTTNVFLTEPRLYGVRVTKDFTAGGWLGGVGERREGPYPFTVEITGQVSRFDGDVESYAPDWLDIYSPTFPMPATQEEALDWGDIRGVKLTYAPPGSSWRVSGAYRYGRTNGQGRGAGYEAVPGGTVIGNDFFGKYFNRDVTSPDNHFRDSVHDTEEYAVVDFMVGMETGIGAWGEGATSLLSVGLRSAEFGSTSHVMQDGVPDRYIQPFLDTRVSPYEAHSSHFTTRLDSDRRFEGVGPSLSWEASQRLFGNDETGHVDLDWTVGGAVLFGKQTVDSSEDRIGLYYFGSPNRYNTGFGFTTTTHYDDSIPRHRSEDVTVPNLSLSLGLSYTIDRVRVSTGYSYDRFFDAIDGGYEDAQPYDRTIHGPYLKLSLGFGG